jgi:homeodomain-containing protein
MNKKYIVRLTEDERQQLLQLPKTGKTAADKIKHAHILLPVDANGPHWSDAQVATAFRCHGNTGRNIRQRCVEQGLEAALARRPQVKPSRQRLLDGATAAHLIALRGSPPPTGVAKWPLKLLADKLVALHVVERMSYETVRQTLKKTRASRPGKRAGYFPLRTVQTLLLPWTMCLSSLSALTTPSIRWAPWTKSLSN